MKAFLVTVTGVKMNRNIDISDSPMRIIQRFYKDDPTAATQIFCSWTAIEYFMEGYVYDPRSFFELIGLEGDSIRAEFKTPLCDQPFIREELSRIEAEGEIPEFVVFIGNFAV